MTKRIRKCYRQFPLGKSVLKAKYNGNTVFFKPMTDPLCYAVFQIELNNYNGGMMSEYHYSGEKREVLNDYKKQLTYQESFSSCKENK